MNDASNILIFTHVQGGLGDIASASKIIALVVREYPTCGIYWVLDCGSDKFEMGLNMLGSNLKEHIKEARTWFTKSAHVELLVDLVIQTPCLTGWTLKYLGRKLNLNLTHRKQLCIAEAGTKLHSEMKIQSDQPYLTLGLSPADGVLLTSLPEFDLMSLDDAGLIHELGAAPKIDSENVSFNFGYAHLPISRYDFVDCTVVHEQDKQTILIIMNQMGEFTTQSADQFMIELTSNETRMRLFSQMKIGILNVSDNDGDFIHVIDEQHTRTLRIVLRHKFSYNDIRILLAGADRLLVTGNNSAFEAWSSKKCRMYVYEDVGNAGVTWRFLQQQVDSSAIISKSVGDLLGIFGGDRRLLRHNSLCLIDQPVYWERVYKILIHDEIGSDNQKWFECIRQNHDFAPALEVGLRTIFLMMDYKHDLSRENVSR